MLTRSKLSRLCMAGYITFAHYRWLMNGMCPFGWR